MTTPAPEPTPAPTPAPAPIAAVPAPAPTPAPVILSGSPTPEPAPVPGAPEPVKGAWADNWRDVLAEQTKPGDTKFRERLNRFGSPAEVTKSWLAIEQKVSSGELKSTAAYPDKGTDADKDAWRKEHGVPDKPEGYEPKLANGMVVGEADKPVIDAFAKKIHGKNWTQTQFNDALQTYYEVQDAQNAQIQALDAEYKTKSEDALRLEWGNDFRGYSNAMDNWLGALPEGLGELLVNGRLADGRKIGADPRFIKAFKDIVFDLNPAAATTLVPAGGDQGQGLTARKTELQKLLKDRSSEYYRGANANALQAEYRRIVEAEQRLKGRAA